MTRWADEDNDEMHGLPADFVEEWHDISGDDITAGIEDGQSTDIYDDDDDD